MAPVLKYIGVGCAVTISAVAMVWSAAPPDDRVSRFVLGTAHTAMRPVAAWLATNPAQRSPDWEDAALHVYDGDASNGAMLMRSYGCGACHTIPGVTGAHGSVGPSLAGFASRAYVAGVLPNRPGGLVRWLVNPTHYAPNTAMPDLDVTEAQARDMAAHLYTLAGQ